MCRNKRKLKKNIQFMVSMDFCNPKDPAYKGKIFLINLKSGIVPVTCTGHPIQGQGIYWAYMLLYH